MRIDYDPDNDTVYIRLRETPLTAESDEVEPGVTSTTRLMVRSSDSNCLTHCDVGPGLSGCSGWRRSKRE